MNPASRTSAVVVVGAGPAGLAVAACLQKKKVPCIVLEQHDHVGSSWLGHYHRLHLHTDKAHSALPFYDFPKSYPRYPSRQQVVDYLNAYARHHQIQPLHGQKIVRACRTEGDWEIHSQDTVYRARSLVVAAGYNREPQRPAWPGMDAYQGQILHSSAYTHGASLKGQRVLVVGLGNSGGEIAIDLHEHGAQPTLAVRSPVNVIRREVFGIPFLTIGILQKALPPQWADALNAPVMRMLTGDLSQYGLRQPDEGPITQIRKHGRVPFIDVGTIQLIKQGQVQVRPGIERFTEQGVVFSDGRDEAFDTVVLATGYRPNVQSWLEVGDGVLGEGGAPVASGQALERAQDLYFCGYHVSATGMLREIAQEALQIGQLIARSHGQPGNAARAA
ncbi:NAD(P)/FAD-dependent oxidoreductase [Aquabacterium sp. CECT 9606]|uniref:flavin-containing monooxygenase n=1 Tax=Aquabacterium sp. CECT 9606 TaxID=2845822 RepID=UPI001E3055C0|nr:NAD(P)/FAD-dependent oxidoreductase [Aquabacterium sp. CECT 9606]CAH0348831.1 putative oxidoreductase CzcO [Aquabacterium sp. CECT 9606]